MHWPCFCNPFQDRRTDRAGRSALRFAVMDEDLGRIQQGRADARKTPCGNAVTSPCAPPALRAVSRRTFPPAASIVNTGCSPSSSAVTKSSVPFADQTGEPGQRSQRAPARGNGHGHRTASAWAGPPATSTALRGWLRCSSRPARSVRSLSWCKGPAAAWYASVYPGRRPRHSRH